MKKIFSSLALLALVLVIGGCGAAKPAPTVTPDLNITENMAAAPDPTATEPTALEARVSISGFAFSPEVLEIKPGMTVVWTNEDMAPHQINSSSFNSDNLGTDQMFSQTFEAAGTYDYHCSLHPSMTGKIIVK